MLQNVLRTAKVQAASNGCGEADGQFDMIVDDGGHYPNQIQASFEFLFNKALKPGGLYVIEDIAPLRNLSNPKIAKRCPYCDGQMIKWVQEMSSTLLGNAGQEPTDGNATFPLHARQARCVVSVYALHKDWEVDRNMTTMSPREVPVV